MSDNNVWQTKFVPSKYLSVKEIEALKKVTITKTTFFSKLISDTFELAFNSKPSIYVSNCYICKCNHSLYTFYKDKVICEEMSHKPRKRHMLIGKTINFEQFQNEKEIVVKSIFEVGIKEDSELLIEKDTKFQGIGIRFNCPKCKEQDLISNLTEIGKKYKCRKCNTDLLETKNPTTIQQVTSVTVAQLPKKKN